MSISIDKILKQALEYHKTGNLDEAKKLYKIIIEINPTNALVHNNLGSIYELSDEFDLAVKYYKNAILNNKDYALAFNNLGAVYQKVKNYEEAKSSYNKALKLKPNLKSSLLGLGQIYVFEKDYKKALKYFDECNNELSRSRSLVCLYHLKRNEEIYERIRANIKIDRLNLRVAAFSSFLESQQNKDTVNNFCKRPLEFIYYSNLSKHISDLNLFIKNIIKELDGIETIWEPSTKTTKKGFQSKYNLFNSKLDLINKLKSIILTEIDQYYFKYKNEDALFIKEWPKVKNLIGWHVVLKQQGYQDSHNHPGGWLSGVIYLKVIAHDNNNSGAIEFSLNGENFFNKNSPSRIYKPVLGDLILFPSSLYHRTIPFSLDTDRIIISFDLLPNI